MSTSSYLIQIMFLFNKSPSDQALLRYIPFCSMTASPVHL